MQAKRRTLYRLNKYLIQATAYVDCLRCQLTDIIIKIITIVTQHQSLAARYTNNRQ